MKFDLAPVDTSLADEGVDMPIRDASGDPIKNSKGETPTLKLLGMDSAVYRTYQRRAVMKRIREAGRKNAQPEKPVEEAADEGQEEAINQFVMMTVGWSGMRDDKGEVIPFSKEAARELYTKYPMIGEQVDTFVSVRSNFIKRRS